MEEEPDTTSMDANVEDFASLFKFVWSPVLIFTLPELISAAPV